MNMQGHQQIILIILFLNYFELGLMQKQRIDGGGNSKSNLLQQQPQRYLQQQQQTKNYNTYENGINDYNARPSQWYYFPAQQENYFLTSPQHYSPQQNQQQQFYSPPQQYSSSSTSFASHAHGVPQLQAAQGAGGQYGSTNAIGSGSQFPQQSLQLGQQSPVGTAQQQITQFSGNSIANGQQILTPDNKGSNNQNFYAYTTIAPLTLPPHPPTFATMMPSLFPTPPAQPVYDHALALRMHKQPYIYNFDFAPGSPVIYCAYGANPIPRYNTPYKKCIPYHPLCGITFTCIFDVDPTTGHVWSHAAETKKRK